MSKEQIIRQWRLLDLLTTKRRGVSVQELLDELGVSRATLYRDFEVLEESGAPLVSDSDHVGAHYRLLTDVTPPPLQPTPAQMVALFLARSFLSALEGTRLVEEYDALLARWRRAPTSMPLSTSVNESIVDSKILRTIEEAMSNRQQLGFHYESASGESGERVVDPLLLRIGKDHQLYLDAHDTRKRETKTYKPIRMHEVRVLAQKAALHPEFDESAMLAHSLKTWSASPVEVQIAISSRKARFVREWPLSRQQQLDPRPEGGVVVRATVAGLFEVSKWVLSWGRDAVVLEPPELREMVREELTEALRGYSDE